MIKNPPQGWVKINFDVAIRPNISIVAVFCRKDNDEILFAQSSSWKSYIKVNVALLDFF